MQFPQSHWTLSLGAPKLLWHGLQNCEVKYFTPIFLCHLHFPPQMSISKGVFTLVREDIFDHHHHSKFFSVAAEGNILVMFFAHVQSLGCLFVFVFAGPPPASCGCCPHMAGFCASWEGFASLQGLGGLTVLPTQAENLKNICPKFPSVDTRSCRN